LEAHFTAVQFFGRYAILDQFRVINDSPEKFKQITRTTIQRIETELTAFYSMCVSAQKMPGTLKRGANLNSFLSVFM